MLPVKEAGAYASTGLEQREGGVPKLEAELQLISFHPCLIQRADGGDTLNE